MQVIIAQTPEMLGKKAAIAIAQKLNAAIEQKGAARLLVSTGASQFETLSELVSQDVDWSKVTMFHLDEYISLPESHPASFRKYLKERFVSKINLKRAVFVDGEGDDVATIAYLNREIEELPVDVGVIGIGVNAHIAFNDPPADFDVRQSYITVDLEEECKRQQVGEGWFKTVEDVPKRAITMTPYRIMQCSSIVSPVPHRVKAEAIRATLASEGVTNMIPATLLKTHPDFTLFLDSESASLCDEALIKAYRE